MRDRNRFNQLSLTSSPGEKIRSGADEVKGAGKSEARWRQGGRVLPVLTARPHLSLLGEALVLFLLIFGLPLLALVVLP